ncbi:MAG: four helix bundle protein [Spartobacteria bacterium]|nr:four helix bundle protein [Spartobacteria bacterium]
MDDNRAGVGQESLLPTHGGYRKLKSFQVAQLVYDVTVRFVERYVDRFSRTRDQMVQAARSGVQNIAEGSQASGTSKKTELKLTNVARASLEELRLDYEDFLRQRGLQQWAPEEPLRRALVNRRCKSAGEVAQWIKSVAHESGRYGHDGRNGQQRSMASMASILSKKVYPELSANAALVLIEVACSLLTKQVQSQAAQFEEEGGFSERVYRVRSNRRQNGRSV